MKFINKEVLKGSTILLITFGLFNFFNYIYHFAMARFLTVSEYGIVAALFSIIYILGIFTESFQTIITKYSSKIEDYGKLKSLLKRAENKFFKISMKIFIIYLLISIFLSPLLKIPYSLMALTGLMIFTSFLLPVNRGIMQGKKMFKLLGANMVLEALIKLILAVILVFAGWKIYGAITGAVVGTIGAFILSFPMLKKIISSKEKKVEINGIYNYSTPVFVLIFTILAFYSIDVIIAKIVFDPHTAGEYAIASILAKTIFFGTFPISKAMFPLSAGESTKSSSKIFNSALTILLICITCALAVFYFFPDFLLSVFSGKILPLSSSVIFYLAVTTSILSLANLNILYKLSRGDVKGSFYGIFFLIFEAILLFTFSSNIVSFSLAFMTSSALFLWWSVNLLREGD